MTKFKEGDKVRIVTNLREGTIGAVYEASHWNMNTNQYIIYLENEIGSVTMDEHLLEMVCEKVVEKPRCVCGVNTVGAGRHSDWCELSTWVDKE